MKKFLKISNQKVDLSGLGASQGIGNELETRPGGWMMYRQGNRQRRVFVARYGKDVFLRNSDGFFYGTFEQKSASGSSGSDGSGFEAQFPGKVTMVLVADGTKVKENEAVLRIEAMKMEISMKAPSPGTVVRVLVQAGQQIHPGQKLVEFKEDKND